MDKFYEAATSTRDTLVILPLIFLCFVPVWQDIRNTLPGLIRRVIALFAVVEVFMFLIYLLLPFDFANPFNMLLCIGVFFPAYQRKIRLQRSHLWFCFCSACLLGAFSWLFIHVVRILLYPDGSKNTIFSTSLFIYQLLFECILIVFLFIPFKKHLSWLIHNFHEERIWKVIWILPAGFTVFSYYFIPYNNRVMYIGRFLKMYIIVLFVLFALVLFIYLMFYQIAYSIVERQELFQKSASLELQAEQYYRLQAHITETSHIRHDFRHQLMVIAEMLKNKKYEELEIYLNEYTSNISDMPVTYCGSTPVNAILNHYAAICSEANIWTQFRVRIKEIPPSLDIDLCVLLGNLLENAVDGCRNISGKDRCITLKLGQTAEYVIALQITNPYHGSVRKQGDTFLSSKHRGEGQGLKSVQMIAKRYHGVADVSYDNESFDVRVLLHLTQEL